LVINYKTTQHHNSEDHIQNYMSSMYNLKGDTHSQTHGNVHSQHVDLISLHFLYLGKVNWLTMQYTKWVSCEKSS
jgi:hypothetical protein